MKQTNNFLINITFLLFCAFLFTNCTKGPTIKSVEKGVYNSEKVVSSQGKKITILPGDTLLYISKKYNLTIKEIIKFNRLKTPYILKPGGKLYIPQYRVYKIKKGEELTDADSLYINFIKDSGAITPEIVAPQKIKILNISPNSFILDK